MDTERPYLRRAFTDSGPRVRLETRSFTTPSFANDEDFDTVYAAQQAPRRRSLFRTAFSLIGAVHDLQREGARQQADERSSRAYAAQRDHEQPRYDDYDRYDLRDIESRYHSSRATEPDTRRSTRERTSPARLHRKSRRDNDRTTGQDNARRARPREGPSSADQVYIKSLESDVLYEEGEVEECSQWLAEYAHREETSGRMVEHMVAQLQRHKRRLREARAALQDAIDRAETPREPEARPSQRRRRTTQQTGRPSAEAAAAGIPPGFDNLFDLFLGGAAQFGSSRGMPGATSQSALFEQLFAEIAADNHFVFTTSRGPQAGTGRSAQGFFGASFGQGFRPQASTAMPSFAQPRPRQPKPDQLLSAQEAKALYSAYNQQWSTIAPSDPDVPYPGRGLQSASLLVKETIWTPSVLSPVSTWSSEDIVRVNTQSFFLAVVDFAPIYTDRAGKIEMDFDHTKAVPAQLQSLIDILKKEKLRWHSDKLGRRNNGNPGANEALQQSEVARGIFHAICELSDCAASKR